MKSVLMSLIILMAVSNAYTAETKSQILGYAIPNKHISIPDKNTAKLPRAVAGTIYPCPAILENGYSVLCRDSQGDLRIAFLPMRDRWGRVTANAWTVKPSLQLNTIIIKKSVQFKPGQILLIPGEEYPVIRQNEENSTIRYSFQDFMCDIDVPKSDITFEPAVGEKSSLRRQKELAALLAAALKEQESLEAQLAESKENTEKLTHLLRQISRTGMEKKRLMAEISKSESEYKKLSKYTTGQDPAIKSLDKRLAQTVQAQGEVSADLKKIHIETEIIRTLQNRVLTAEAQLTRLQADTERRQSELSALLEHEKDKSFQQEKKKVKNLLHRANTTLANVAGQLQKIRTGKDILDTLQKQLESTNAEAEQLQQQLNQLNAEMDALQNTN